MRTRATIGSANRTPRNEKPSFWTGTGNLPSERPLLVEILKRGVRQIGVDVDRAKAPAPPPACRCPAPRRSGSRHCCAIGENMRSPLNGLKIFSIGRVDVAEVDGARMLGLPAFALACTPRPGRPQDGAATLEEIGWQHVGRSLVVRHAVPVDFRGGRPPWRARRHCWDRREACDRHRSAARHRPRRR